MAVFGYCGHYDFLGRTPYDRYAEAGGGDFVGENVAIRSCGSALLIDREGIFDLKKNHMFSQAQLDECINLQTMFMEEKPPYDGHRIQILQTEHTNVGLGISYAENSKGDYRLTLTEEFIDKYGEYLKIPKKITRGKPFVLAGTMLPGVAVYSVSVYCDREPVPMTKQQLNGTKGCRYPSNKILSIFSVDKFSPLKVWTEAKRQHFTVPITPGEDWKSGLYYVEIAAVPSRGKEPIRVSFEVTQLE